MNLDDLGPPNFHVLIGREADFAQLSFGLNYHHFPQWAVRVLRGHKMASLDALFDEWAAALQFPYYFGANWPAFHECMTDLEWIPAQSYVLAITRAANLLTKEPVERSTFFRILNDICVFWREVPSGHRQTKPVPFHVLFQGTQSEVSPIRELLQPFEAEISVIAAETSI